MTAASYSPPDLVRRVDRARAYIDTLPITLAHEGERVLLAWLNGFPVRGLDVGGTLRYPMSSLRVRRILNGQIDG